MRKYSNIQSVIDAIIGACFLVYGGFGWGKTRGLTTLPIPIAFVNTEPRDPRRVVGNILGVKDVTFFEPEGFDDYMELYNKMEERARVGTLPYKSVCTDSFSFAQQSFRSSLEDDRNIVRLEKEKHRGLIDRFRLDESDWGASASIMQRITAAMNRLSKHGIITVATASVSEHPRWNREISAAPAFAGKQFPLAMNGYFDFIGFLTEKWRYDEKGNAHPSRVSFVSEDDSFIAKCVDDDLNRIGTIDYDFKKILSVIQKKGGEGKSQVTMIKTETKETEAEDSIFG